MAKYFYIDVTDSPHNKILESFKGILVDFLDFEEGLQGCMYENETVRNMHQYLVYYPEDLLDKVRKNTYYKMFLRTDKKPNRFQYMEDGTFRDAVRDVRYRPEEFYGSDEELAKAHEVINLAKLTENTEELSASRQRDARKLINRLGKYLPAIDNSAISGGISILKDGKVKLSSHICYGFMRRQRHFDNGEVKHYLVSLKRHGDARYTGTKDKKAKRGHELMYNYVIKESPFKRVLKDGGIPFEKAIESGVAIDTEFSFMDIYVAAMFLRNSGEEKRRSKLFQILVEEHGISPKAASILIQYFYIFSGENNEDRVSYGPLGVHGVCDYNSLETGINFLDKHKPKKSKGTSLRGGFVGVFEYTRQYPVEGSKPMRDWFTGSFGGNGWNFESPELDDFVAKLKETYGDLLV